jgi:cytochrome oxidase Cu insertion factor (SCO1/SenC/PrrC family)
MRHSFKRLHAVAFFAICATATSPQAQQPPAAPTYPSPEVGALAPDFTLPAASRYGVLRDSIKLSDYRGKTVVLAFFFKARTKG